MTSVRRACLGLAVLGLIGLLVVAMMRTHTSNTIYALRIGEPMSQALTDAEARFRLLGVLELVSGSAAGAALIAFLFTTFVVTEQRRDRRTCPFCAESIRLTATKCRYCGSELPPA